MRIGMAQTNSTLGDFANNRSQMLEAIHQAQRENCDLVVFPECSLFGYHPTDLLERSSIVEAQLSEFDKLARAVPKGIAVVMGLFRPNPNPRGKPYYNSAAFLVAGKPPKFFNKQLLPTYDVFDEARYIEPGEVARNLIKFKGVKILVTICEDIWAWDRPGVRNQYAQNPLKAVKASDVDLVVNLSASPFAHGKIKDRERMVRSTARFLKAPMVYVNMVGAQDELIFDGGSFAVDAKGTKLAQSPHFKTHLNVVDLANRGELHSRPRTRVQWIREALVLGLRDFVTKTGLERVHLGLSGGIDSAVVACLACEALGPEKVHCIGLPGPYNAPESLTLARTLAQNLKIRWSEIPIEAELQSFVKSLKTAWQEAPKEIVSENLQARIRGVLLMAVSNQEQSLLLTTGNKDEYATGYSTLYGDMCGGLAPLADLFKGEVYALARSYNQTREMIPERILSRPPSAELKPEQKDQDTLPPYEQLDRAVAHLVEKAAKARSETERWVLSALLRSEFKRWQAPPVLKVSGRAFGRGRRWPVAHRART